MKNITLIMTNIPFKYDFFNIFVDTHSKHIAIAAKRNNEFLFNAIIHFEILLVLNVTLLPFIIFIHEIPIRLTLVNLD